VKTDALSTNRLLLASGLALTLLAGCGKDSDASQQAHVDPVQAVTVTVGFQGRVGVEPFSCTTTYPGIGTPPQVLTPKDFRFYVHDVRLVTGGGAEVPVAVAEDGVWQHAGVTLLDFEDGTGTCSNGNSGTNTKVIGTVPVGSYSGLRFKVGVPSQLNHLNVATQPSPLNFTALYWSWTSGYRFMRIEGTSPGALLHLGSTACTLVDAADPNKGSNCVNANRVDVDLPAFDVATDKVTLDLADLWSATDLTTNTTGTATGCMSAPTDPECAPVFLKLGLPFGTSTGGTQTVFKKG
jgi:uncharacterized repeat protein (TIGR04052 family)